MHYTELHYSWLRKSNTNHQKKKKAHHQVYLSETDSRFPVSNNENVGTKQSGPNSYSAGPGARDGQAGDHSPGGDEDKPAKDGHSDVRSAEEARERYRSIRSGKDHEEARCESLRLVSRAESAL